MLVARIHDERAAAVDDLVAAGAFTCRSEAVRRDLEHLVERHRRSQIGACIADGYRPTPPTEVGGQFGCQPLFAPWVRTKSLTA